MKKSLLLLLLLVAGSQLRAADYYWVGGSGNWSDLNHWRLGSSTGAIPSIVPSSADNVFFDDNSGFTSASKTVTLDANGYCNNITWGNVTNSAVFTTSSYSFAMQVYGNIVLTPITYYQLMFNCLGSTASTLTSGGTIGGQFGLNIDKGTGSLTVTDSLVAPTNAAVPINGVTLTSGTFDITGKKMLTYVFGSQNNNVRTLEMTNATVTCNTGTSSGFKVTGLNKTVHATGSTVTAFGYNTDEGIYNRTTITSGNGPNTVFVNNSTFSKLIFTATGYLYPNIGANNTVDTVIFSGIGTINSNNTVGYVQFGNTASITGTGNVIGKMVCQNALTVTGNFTNTVDSLILAPNRATSFKGTFNVNKYLSLSGAPCDAYTELYGDSTAGTVNFASGAVVAIDNVILSGVKATGPVTPIALNGIDGGGNAGFTITEPASTGTTLYWVGGAGDWNNKAHWSFTSGGTGGACVPFKGDSVVFDGNSGLAGQTVTTSSSSFCKDITWAAGVGATTFNESATNSFRVYGSATLQPTVTMSALFEFYGTSAATLTTNGGGTTGFSFYVVKSGAGSVTLADNWSCPGGSIQYYAGGLNMAGRTVTCSVLNSSNSYVRSLDITNATINAQWVYLGANKTLAATGSHITSNGGFQCNAPNSSYPWVDLNATSGFSISGTTFGQLTFASTSVTSAAGILSGNTIRRLEFKGAGAMGNTGSNNIDSLILAGSRNYVITGTNTINKYMYAQATPCAGLTEMRGSPGTLAFGSSADVHIDNVYLQSITATGVITPVAITGADAGGNSGWSFTPIAGGPRYWVGGAGDWNDNNHWSTASGGATGACIPTVSNDVYFDAASGFTSASKTVTVNNGNAYCHSVNWTGAANAPVWNQSASWSIEIWGDSLILNPAATFNTALTLKGTTAAFLKNTALGNLDIYIDKPGSSLTLLNNYTNFATDIAVLNGTLNASGLSLGMSSINNNPAPNNVIGININNSTFTAGIWRVTGTIANHTLNAANSNISVGSFTTNGLQYNTVSVSGTSAASAAPSSATINRLTFTDPSTTSAVGINGNSNTIGTVEFKGSGGIYGTGNVMDTLIFFPGDTYTLNAGSNNTINDAWYGSGTPCHATQIASSSTTTNATITKTSGDVDFDYVRLKRVTAAGTAAPFAARSHSTDLGNNVSWTIDPYNGAAPIYGLGPDTTVPALPYTLHTDGFFGSPASQYLWNNGSTADSLVAADTGTYTVNVSFVDGCNISDQIRIKLPNPLGLTLLDFNAKVQDCQARLNWQVADVKNFSHFAVERSADGRNFATIASLKYTGAVDYTYIDPVPENGTNYYRLKLADIGTQYSYSKIVSANIDCRSGEVQVYPTVTSGRVRIILPKEYSGAKAELYNISGQLMSSYAEGTDTFRTIDLDGLPNAMYVLRIINGNEIVSFKIQKQ